jgi:DNA-directed RNA polymerase specialized sigma24 family protein
MDENFSNDNQFFEESNLELDAFKEIYHANFKRVYFFVNRFSLRSEDTEEIVQDVFLKLCPIRNRK